MLKIMPRKIKWLNGYIATLLKNNLTIYQFNNAKAFTLIELIVAIAIVAIISAVGFVSYSQAQKLGRDSKRKSDLQEISKALQLYYNDNSRYPQSGNNDWQETFPVTTPPWINDLHTTPKPLNSNYISALPLDPVNNATYHYEYFSDGAVYNTCAANQYYMLVATLENDQDPDLYIKKPFGFCGYSSSSLPGFCSSAACKLYVVAGG